MIEIDWIAPNLEAWFVAAVRENFPDDKVLLDSGMSYFPSDEGLMAIAVLYIQINGTDEVDGVYLMQGMPPSTVNKESVFEAVADLAKQSEHRRGAIRASLARGNAPGGLGLPRVVRGR